MKNERASSPFMRLALPLLALLIAGLVITTAAETPVFTKHQKAFYLSEQDLLFIRPGLDIKIVNATIDAGGKITARFTITDPGGLPLDLDGVFTPGAVQTSFVVGTIPAGQSLYTSYITRNVSSSITNTSAVQATSDSGGTYAKVADGEYTYTFRTLAPSGYNRGATHTVGVYARRVLDEFGLGETSDDSVFTFVPNGSPVTVTRDIARTASCNACHERLTVHGRRHSVELCILCHTPQSTDPDTGNTVDMTTMVHKIHMGEGLPSVEGGKPYQIIGFGGSVHDYSTVVYPADVRNCQTCHKDAAQGTHYMTNPTRRACGACHDNVNFATGQNHANLPQVSDNQCKTCHIPEGELEFDVSILGAHTVPRFSKELPGTNFEILNVSDTAPGKTPTVTFSIKNDAGNPIIPADMTSLNLVMGTNTLDITGYVSNSARTATGNDGVFFHTFNRPIPADATGSWLVGIEGYRNVTLLPGTVKEQVVRDAGENKVFYFPVTDAQAVPRRKVVQQARCDTCHFDLDIHGSNRNDVEHCVICHNPTNTDAAVRPADQMPAQAINFKHMIHKIHTGEEIDASQKPYIIYGFRSSVHNYSHVRFPGNRAKCETCHIPGTEQLPLRAGLLPTAAPRDLIDPMPPVTSACLSCHTNLSAAAHADINTSAKFGESCATCHGPDAEFSIDRVHAQ